MSAVTALPMRQIEQWWPIGSFWETRNGKTTIDPGRLIGFLARNGFRKAFIADGASVVVEKNAQFVREVQPERAKSFVLQLVQCFPESVADREAIVSALIAGANRYFRRETLECLPEISVASLTRDPDSACYYYRNGVVRVTADGVEMNPYDQGGDAIWASHAKERDFTVVHFQDIREASDFAKFLFNVCGNDETRYRCLCSAIGYVLHPYKDRSQAKAICFLDERISDEPSGRTGKSTVGKAISCIVPAIRFDGRNFSISGQFAFQQWRPGTQVLEFNDTGPRFPLDRLFSVITDDMQIERKHRDRITVPFEQSPKILLSTNYVLAGTGPSHDDRILEVEFSDYYGTHHRPVDDFGRRFFDQWDDEQWNLFDNFMLRCVQLFIREGLVDYKRVNVAERKLREMTSPTFAEFAKNGRLRLGERYDKKALYTDYLGFLCEDGEAPTQGIFTSWLKTWANVNGYWADESHSGPVKFIEFERRQS